MNILVIVKLYFHRNKSGGEKYLHILLKRMLELKTKIKITILIPDSKEIKKFEYEKLTIFETTETLEDCLLYIPNSDLVITQLDYSNEVVKKCIELDKKVINIYHGAWEGYKPLVYHSSPNYIKVFNSVNVFNDLSSKIYSIDNYYIINPMCDFPMYNKYKNKDKSRREYITLINPSKNKGADLVLEIAKNNPDRKFLIVEGGYYSHEQLPYITEFRKLSNCHIAPNTRNICEDVYLKSKIVMMPSKYESWGMVASEAASMGIPVIFGIGEENEKIAEGLIENIGKLSLNCPRNAKDLEKLIYLLDHPPTYHLWSNLYNEIAEENFYKNEAQIYDFFQIIFKKVL